MTLKDKFRLFLFREKAYQKFLCNLMHHNNITKHIDEYLEHMREYMFVQGAFVWSTTKQGRQYWNDINNKWIRYGELNDNST